LYQWFLTSFFTTEIYVRWHVNETTFALFERKTEDKKIILKEQRSLLSLSHSSEGSPALAVSRPHYFFAVFRLTIPGFLKTFLMYLLVILAFIKNINKVLGWKYGHKVPLLLTGPSCPLQAIQLGDLVGCVGHCRL
jgi:hypothetical protein